MSAEPAKSGAPDSPGPFKVGLLGHGTVGAAFAELLEERAAEIERFNGRRPVLAGVLTRSRGSFEEVLAGADLVVELMGGTEPAREYLLAAMRAGKDVVSANKQLLSQHGEELFEVAREHDVRLRFEAAVAGAVPIVRLLEESLAATPIERIHGIVNGTTNFILSEMARGSDYAQALAEAQRLGYAEADPSDDVSGRDAAAKMAILARLAFGAPVSLDDVQLRGDDLEYARELGLGLKLIGTAERREGGLSVRVHPAFLYSGHPLSSVSGPFNAVTVESEAVTEITMSGPGAGGPQTASAVLGDVVSVMTGGARPPAPPLAMRILEDVQSAFYLHLEVADRPGVLAAVTRVLEEQGVSIRSFVQRGHGAGGGRAGRGGASVQRGEGAADGRSERNGDGERDVRLVMVIHPLAESRLREALRALGELDFVRPAPRAIRVIEEEFG
jgi:homoserine dehydrogenase